jgi:hypothetical protein
MARRSSTPTRILFRILFVLAVAAVSFFIGFELGPYLLNRILS